MSYFNNDTIFFIIFLLRILNINRSVTQYLIEVDVSVSRFGSQCDPKVIESPPNNVVLDSSVNLKCFFSDYDTTPILYIWVFVNNQGFRLMCPQQLASLVCLVVFSKRRNINHTILSI